MPLHPWDFPGKRVLEWGAIIFFQLNRWVNNKCSFIPFFIFSLFLTPKVFKDFGLVLIPPLLSLPLENKAVSCWPILGSKRIQEEQVKWGLAHEWEGHSLIGFLCSRKKNVLLTIFLNNEGGIKRFIQYWGVLFYLSRTKVLEAVFLSMQITHACICVTLSPQVASKLIYF